ncbi:aminotransferase class III-fold pyridoxal phosphate-dependent enzyme [Bradyrhizobium sp.]|uniref:aminotransferase class III-fold pyridoxal phosphate-dependent enzyme n=1 Tax=Bradyrhizobium sp. TaxID=376 RepID=UPI0039E2FB9F
MSYSQNYDPDDGIAIVGMAGRFPGARSPAELWRNLLEGRETISSFRADELDPADADELAARSDPAYVAARGIIEDVDKFDAGFFGITPREAEVLDPQQRIFLEAAWEALEDAGYDPRSFAGPIGVYAGASNNTYFKNLIERKDVTELVGWLTTMMGNEKDYLATRVAYKLDLRGPALNIVTACSTSLVAVATAVQSLSTWQCDMALAGGVSITLPQKRGYLSQEGAITSPDGHCRAFDADAGGTVFSNGLGIVVLRRLSDAIASNDRIYAVIKGAALNNDGSAKVSFTAPSVEGHAQVIASAHALAGIDPDTISYVEAHGTGTSLGDPIEIAGLTQAFRAGGAVRNGSCALGSLKTNIGHLDAAAGVAGLIKTALALYHRTLPATLHFRAANPKLDLENTPFVVNTQCRPWDAGGHPLRAGVSSFGVGGTNAHVVLEEAPKAASSEAGRSSHLIVLSARTPAGLEEQRRRLTEHLAQEPELDLPDTAFTLQTGRRAFEYRQAFSCSDHESARKVLSATPATTKVPRSAASFEGVAFMFPGQGSQYVGMGRSLYDEEPLFRREIDESCEVLRPILGRDLRQIIYPGFDRESSARDEIRQTRFTQPALFAVEHALARLWMSWGVQPAISIGHSLGEYVSATIAGTFERDAALKLVAKRAAMMQALPSGAMLAVKTQPAGLAGLLTEGVCVAAYNTPGLVVVSGAHDAIAEFERELSGRSIAHRRLETSHAFHSPAMDAIVESLQQIVREAGPKTPRTPWISSLAGELIDNSEAVDPAYWARQMRQPVRFSEGVRRLREGALVLLEVGPGRTLETFARQHGSRPSGAPMLTSLPAEPEEAGKLGHTLQALGELWCAGCPVDWQAFNEGRRRRRISLPTYAFERTRYWVDPPSQNRSSPTKSSGPQNIPQSVAPQAAVQGIDLTTAQANTSSKIMSSSASNVESLRRLLADLSGLEAGSLDPTVPLVELGLDSLALTQAAAAVNKRFGAKIKFRELLDDHATIATLAERLPSAAPDATPSVAQPPRTEVAGAAAANPPAATATHVELPHARGGDTLDLIQLLGQNAQLMARQLDILQQLASQRVAPATPAAAPTVSAVPANVAQPLPSAPDAKRTEAPSQAFGPYRPPVTGVRSALSAEQRHNLGAFTQLYSQATKKSKELAAKHRNHLSDPRSNAGFRQHWKEIVYPIVSVRSQGSRLWDVDGNEYVDLVNGFGSVFFGHNPEFIRSALKTQLDAGVEIGPQSPMAGEVAELICEMVGMERAAFCNTGSEAVTAAIRTARTVTGRDKIVMFAGAYHGIFDEVLARPATRDGAPRARPIAPGIPEAMTDNVIVLEYGQEAALDVIRARADELAAVLVEPVQSRRPDLQPREFLHELRAITAASGTALVFDEVVTGFRVHPGGMQSVFGIKADLATYGKVLGGGLPIGIIAGDARFLDALDGGTWRFGDESGPEVGVTFFAGTFVRHPLALAGARAVLERLRDGGQDLQRELNMRTLRFVKRLNDIAEEASAPVRLRHFASWFMFDVPSDAPLASLFFAYMRRHGVHIWEGRPGFLTLAHSDADLDRVADAFGRSLEEMQRADFLPGHREDSPPIAGARLGRDAQGNKAWFVPDPDRRGKFLQLNLRSAADA